MKWEIEKKRKKEEEEELRHDVSGMRIVRQSRAVRDSRNEKGKRDGFPIGCPFLKKKEEKKTTQETTPKEEEENSL